MNIKFWRAAILAGIIVWVWSGVSWVILPWHQAATKQFRNESEVTQVLQDNTTSSGVYALPGLSVEYGVGHGNSQQGSYFFGPVHPEGRASSSYMLYFYSLFCSIVAAAIICWLILQAKGISFWKQVQFAMLMGLFAGVVLCNNDWVWAGYSRAYVAVSIVDLLIAWFFGGIVIAKNLANKGD